MIKWLLVVLLIGISTISGVVVWRHHHPQTPADPQPVAQSDGSGRQSMPAEVGKFLTAIAIIVQATRYCSAGKTCALDSGASTVEEASKAALGPEKESFERLLNDHPIDEQRRRGIAESLRTLAQNGHLAGSVLQDIRCSTAACEITMRSESLGAQSMVAYDLVSRPEVLSSPSFTYDRDLLVTTVYVVSAEVATRP
jgi:hypothetical protein